MELRADLVWGLAGRRGCRWMRGCRGGGRWKRLTGGAACTTRTDPERETQRWVGKGVGGEVYVSVNGMGRKDDGVECCAAWLGVALRMRVSSHGFIQQFDSGAFHVCVCACVRHSCACCVCTHTTMLRCAPLALAARYQPSVRDDQKSLTGPGTGMWRSTPEEGFFFFLW